ncbi:MAG: hypothetical protein WCK18_19325 [Prolixibacteraceae bacterium]
MKDVFCDVEVIQSFDQFNHTMVLKEDENRQLITIGGIPDGSILLKLDVNKPEYKQKSKYLKRGEPFIHKGCDYCLIIPSKDLIILFELKSMKPKVKDYVDQFVASEIFIRYCNNLSNYKNCTLKKYTFKRILLSPKYNYGLTGQSHVIDISKNNSCGEKIKIKTPGFPHRIRLEKLI